MQELELYKLCCTSDNECKDCLVEELGWINETEFCVWVSYLYLDEFIGALVKLFGEEIFDDGGFNANMQSNSVCINLAEVVDVDLEVIFPKAKYQH